MNQLTAGNTAIPFTAKDIDGNTINLASYKGKKVYLVFFRKAACPFCNMGLRELIQKNEEFEAKGPFVHLHAFTPCATPFVG